MEPPPIPRERKTKFLDSPTSNENSISSGTKTIIIEKADVHQSAPPIPLPRKKLTNQTNVSPQISSDSQSDDKTSIDIQSIPTITEVRAIKSFTNDIESDDDDKNNTIFLEKKISKSKFLIKTTKSDEENSGGSQSIDRETNKTSSRVVPIKKSSILPLSQKDNISVEIVNEKKTNKEKLPILVENNSTEEDDKDYEKSTNETESSIYSKEFNSDEYFSNEDELKDDTKQLTKIIVKHPNKERGLNSKIKQIQYNYEYIIGNYNKISKEKK